MRLRSVVPLLLLAAAVGAVSYAATAATTTPIRAYGPSITLATSLDSACCASTRSGGIVTGYKSGTADTLLVGDVVYFDSATAGIVHKSATLANYNKLAGVVVGGSADTMLVHTDSGSVGSTAALPSQKVILLRFGVTWVKVDSVDTIYGGYQMIPSSHKYGLVMQRTTAIDSQNRIFGRALQTGLLSTKILAQINVK